MTTYLPPELLGDVGDALQARSTRRNRLRVTAQGRTFQVLRMDDSGFWILAEGAPQLRGLVDLHEGSRHIVQALVIASEEEAGTMRYEYKRATVPSDRPADDFERPDEGPAGFLAPG